MADEQPPRHPGGRPSILTPELQGRIVDALSKGLPIKLACEYVGIHDSTYYDWQQRIPEFAEAVRHARIGGVIDMLDLVRKAGREDWRAAVESVRLAFPLEFAKRIGTAELKDHEREALGREIADAIGEKLITALEGAGLSDEQHDHVREALSAVFDRDVA